MAEMTDADRRFLESLVLHTVDDAVDRIAEFATLGPTWDSYGADPVSPTAIAKAQELVRTVAEVPYGVAPVADGGVFVEWRADQRKIHVYIEVEVGADARLGYLIVDKSGPARKSIEMDDVPTWDTVVSAVKGVLASTVWVLSKAQTEQFVAALLDPPKPSERMEVAADQYRQMVEQGD